MRVLGAVTIVVAALVGTTGVVWAVLAIVGNEWDYCPSGGDCLPGELAGVTFVAVAAVLGWLGLRLVKTD